MNKTIQENAIVSTILKNNQCTHFAIDQGQTISSHVSDALAIALVLDGEIEFMVDDCLYTKKTNEFIQMPANIPHALKARIPSTILLIQIREEVKHG